MARPYLVILFAALFLASCTIPNPEGAAKDKPMAAASPTATSTPAPTPESTPIETAGKSATLACQTINVGKDKVYKKQTFAIDFEPFRGSCFVSTYNPEYPDPPMESQFAIYKNGKKVFDFPSQFNGVSFGCWIDAVSFQDLDKDTLMDVIVVGKCQAKIEDYNENAVYMNDGKEFTTREDANNRLSDFTTVKQVADFVAENKTMFF